MPLVSEELTPQVLHLNFWLPLALNPFLMIEYAIRPGAYKDHGLFYRTLPYFLIVTSNMSPINVPIMNMITRITTVMNIPIAVAAEYISPITNASISNIIFSASNILKGKGVYKFFYFIPRFKQVIFSLDIPYPFA